MKCDGDLKQLETTECESTLGVYICNTLKPTAHCCKAANKAMSALRLLKIAFGALTEFNFKLMYTVYIRTHLEYCIQTEGPYMMQDLDALEKVQRRATRLSIGFKGLPYEETQKAESNKTVLKIEER